MGVLKTDYLIVYKWDTGTDPAIFRCSAGPREDGARLLGGDDAEVGDLAGEVES